MPLIYRPPPLATSQTSRRRTAVGRMYPRARVREQADPVSRQDTTAAYLLGFIESLSLDSHQRTKLYDAAHATDQVRSLCLHRCSQRMEEEERWKRKGYEGKGEWSVKG
ncbi:hypothetical protein AXF42_Ash005664 [Apostasia shenzhenica]|uniref:Uncharacterized protein n=1 Tax=Apostasia shenzhenica TaxID=1088818 RepID=A0A2I0BC27_9ASPA|nr:hypothetical protein AXF42_Ash005664 [Apostasia shenzhenica]